jgi:hypothetical protein
MARYARCFAFLVAAGCVGGGLGWLVLPDPDAAPCPPCPPTTVIEVVAPEPDYGPWQTVKQRKEAP